MRLARLRVKEGRCARSVAAMSNCGRSGIVLPEKPTTLFNCRILLAANPDTLHEEMEVVIVNPDIVITCKKLSG